MLALIPARAGEVDKMKKGPDFADPPPSFDRLRMSGTGTKKGPAVANPLPGRDKKRPGRCRPGLGSFGRGCLKGRD